MSGMQVGKLVRTLGLAVLLWPLAACLSSSANNNGFYGFTEPQPGKVFRYVNGPEPQTLDPHQSSGQPEARIFMALFEGLTEYDPKTLKPIPAVAERWENNRDFTEFTFYLRKTARWSDGTPITARDFVYSLRRGMSPKVASPTAELAYQIKYAEAFSKDFAFARNPADGSFLLEKDFRKGADVDAPEAAASPSPENSETTERVKPRKEPEPKQEDAPPKPAENDFQRLMRADNRVAVPTDEAERNKFLQANLKLKRAVEGKELVPVKAEDIGIEALNDYTVRITLSQPAPYFLSSTPHQMFKLVPRQAVEKYGDTWTEPQHIVSCGPFKVKEWLPYNRLVLVKDPNYWDAANVKLERIEMYPSDELTTVMNLYKAGEIDAALNHSVPTAWLEEVSKYKDYMKAPEAGNTFVKFNTTKPPMDRAEVRRAFNLAIDKNAYATWRKTVLPLFAFAPEGIFAGYKSPRGDQFNPGEAKKLLAAAGYRDSLGNYDPAKFPVNEVEFLYNVSDSNKAVGDYLQAQWKQNLGLTVPLKAVEWTTFSTDVHALNYKGLALGAWGADYMDPYTFLGLFYSKDSNSDTGWYDPAYSQMLDEANKQLDPARRLDMMAKAEAYLLNAQPFIPLGIPSTNFMKKPYVKGFYPNAGSLYAWKFVYIEEDPSRWDQGVPKMTE
jgi:oligopeptide transport system substrate-binding protein